ncbi:hypothetical protein KC726_06035 [Candidatus Woesebacteria bacterium]|nr:hypothetical protein [Candidatus Woesebacteria bacterium]
MKNKIGYRLVLFVVILISLGMILFYYSYAGSKASDVWDDKEYIESLQRAAKGKQLVGTPLPTPVQEETPPMKADFFTSIIQQLLGLVQK